MNFDQHFQRAVLVMIFCHTYRDWGVIVQVVALLFAMAYAFYASRSPQVTEDAK